MKASEAGVIRKKVKVAGVKRVKISGEYIKLDSLLKYASIASSGAHAKFMIQSGDVYVNGEPCEMRGKKIRPGNVVRTIGDMLLVE